MLTEAQQLQPQKHKESWDQMWNCVCCVAEADLCYFIFSSPLVISPHKDLTHGEEEYSINLLLCSSPSVASLS